jgi:hypothetical protein
VKNKQQEADRVEHYSTEKKMNRDRLRKYSNSQIDEFFNEQNSTRTLICSFVSTSALTTFKATVEVISDDSCLILRCSTTLSKSPSRRLLVADRISRQPIVYIR